MYHPFLIGKKVYLRGLEEKDLAGDYFQWFNDPETCKYNQHAVFPNSEKKQRDYFNFIQESKNIVVFAIIEKKNDKHVGNITLKNIDWISRSAEFAIILGAKHFGKGYGYEASSLVIRYGFERLNLIRIHSSTSVKNIAMQKLAEKLKMKKEGIRRKAMYKWGEYVDVCEYGIVRDGYI